MAKVAPPQPMQMEHDLNRLEYLIDRQNEGARGLKVSSLETPWVATVERNKITQNLDYARLQIASLVVRLDSSNSGLSLFEQTRLKSQTQQLETKLQSVEALLHESEDLQEEKLHKAISRIEHAQLQRQQKETELKKQSDDESTTRKRLFASQRDEGTPPPDDRALHRQRELQEDISEDLVKMSEALKMQAHHFHDKMQLDNEAVDSTARSLDKSSEKMTKTGSRLDKYRSSTAITWKFYIISFLFILLAVLIAIISSRIPRFM